MKKIWIAALAALAVGACTDFGNSKKSVSEEAPQISNPAPPQKNPFPPGYENPNEGAFAEWKLLVNVGVNFLAKSARGFSLEAQLLEERVREYCSAIDQGGTGESELSGARSQWKRAMLGYHALEAVAVGPLTDSGRFLADNIYSWPYFNACGVDLEAMKLAESRKSNPKKLFTVKGLRALEYLLFEPSLVTACSAANPKAREWTALPTAEKRRQRCAYALDLAQELSGHARTLEQAWDPAKGNFTKTLVDGSRYPSVSDAVNALSDGLYFLEIVKDQKIGRPLGRHKDCVDAAGKCPGDVEHRYSGISLEALGAQLKAFQTAFFGSTNPDGRGVGFDDFLRHKGRGDVVDSIRRDLDRALSTLEEASSRGSFQEQIGAMNPGECGATTVTNRKVPLCAFFQDVRSVATTMKVEVLTILKLRAPPFFGGGDND